MVYYRKYRPQTIAELDLESVRNRLTSILTAEELPHAFLFTGPKGLGKTSSARILAKAINCEQRNKELGIRNKDGNKIRNSKLEIPDSGIEPCNKCEACRTITNGSNIDVIEIDAASNRGIDEIRDLREKLKYAPVSLKNKVYIIDEVHMLTNEAFNALLKTLEEPPSHVVFILCTTEADKIPPTILSRAFSVLFQKPKKNELVASLKRIAKGEKLDVESQVLENIFVLSEGSFRDAAKVLEDLSLAAGRGKKITPELLEKNYKTESIGREAVKLIESLSEKNIQNSLSVIESLADRGTDFKIFTEKLADLLHSEILFLSGVAVDAPFDTSEKPSVSEINSLLSLINDSYKNIKAAVIPQLPLELAVIEWCINSSTNLQEEGERPPEADVDSKKPQVSIEKNEKEKSEEPDEGNLNHKRDHGDLFKPNARSDNFLAALLSALKRDNHSLAGMLRGCRLVEISNGSVIFETKYKFHKDKLSEPSAISTLNERSSEILREKVHVVVNIVEK